MAGRENLDSAKQKVTLSIDRELWRKFIIKVIWDTGKQKGASFAIEKLIRNFLGEKID